MGTLKPGIGYVIRCKRKQLQLSQEALAERSGLDRSYISMLERELGSPTLRALQQIAHALQTKPSVLLVELETLNELGG